MRNRRLWHWNIRQLKTRKTNQRAARIKPVSKRALRRMRAKLRNQLPGNRREAVNDIMANDEVRTMMHQGRMVTNQGPQLAGRAALLAGCAALLGLAGIPDLVLAQDSVAAQAPTAYRDLPLIGSR